MYVVGMKVLERWKVKKLVSEGCFVKLKKIESLLVLEGENFIVMNDDHSGGMETDVGGHQNARVSGESGHGMGTCVLRKPRLTCWLKLFPIGAKPQVFLSTTSPEAFRLAMALFREALTEVRQIVAVCDQMCAASCRLMAVWVYEQIALRKENYTSRC